MGARTGRVWRSGLGCALLVCAGWTACAQSVVPQAALVAELQDLASHAATIFVGQICRTERHGGVVDVVFRVEQPVRGNVRSTVMMREWAGSWPPGQRRYLVGQRVLAFLYGSSGAGLGSPVHGAEGLVPVVVQGADAPQLLDVRRVAASVQRAPGVALPTERDGAYELGSVLKLLTRGTSGRFPELLRLPIPVRARAPMDILRGNGAPQQPAGPVTQAGRLQTGWIGGVAGRTGVVR